MVFNLKDEFDNPKGTPLVYDDYKKYEVKPRFEKGQWCFEFKNGYGASVIKRYGSYGYGEDLFELAVTYNDRLCYSTEITDDVLGYLTNQEVLDTLEKIKNLKKEGI